MTMRHPSLMSVFALVCSVAVSSAILAPSAEAASVTVPGTANPWLAGMPNGTPALFGDAAPAQSPVLVTELPIVPGRVLNFRATGLVHIDPTLPNREPPDGGSVTHHNALAENGVGDTHAPFNSLLGVFLGPDQPNLTAPPPATDFTSLASRDYLTLSPQLKQTFFIGDGLTRSGAVQSIVVPEGATRLFLGTMDSVQ